MKQLNDWQKLQDEIEKWSDNQFGFNRPPTGSINHLIKEVQELKEEQYCLEEYADCLMLILDAARMAGYNCDNLFKATQDKLKVNKNRKWGPLDKDGVSEHIRK